ncbi:aldo/keto reductase [Nocardiopsis alba]|uniref:aldo/keto reductase n=1 Tax=Nocardiopsis alba TaxID=53437 RepID=UPI0037F8535E
MGSTGLRISRLLLGAMTFADPDEGERMVDLYQEAGGDVIDTASAYHDSEEVLGRALKGRRDRFVLSTKFGLPRDPDHPGSGGAHRKNLTLSLDRSLRRLRTDHVDLLWVHTWDPHTPIAETMRALDDMVRAGKVLYLGASNLPAWVVARADTIARYEGWTTFSALQVPYNPLHRDIERELLPLARTLDMTVTTYNPLATGILSGRYTDPAPGTTPTGRLRPQDLSARQHEAARTVIDLARELDTTPARVSLAWSLARSPRLHPIIGASTTDQLRDNLGSLEVDLPGQAMERLNALAGFEPGYPYELNASTPDWIDGDRTVRSLRESPFG